MSTPRPTLIEWLGFSRYPDFTKARWLGGLISVTGTVVALVLVVLALGRFFMALSGIGDFENAEAQSAAIRNNGLVVAALIGVPFLIWRTSVAHKQARIAQDVLFKDKINAASEDLHAMRTVWHKKRKTNVSEPDIIRRCAAVSKLHALVEQDPASAKHISNILSTYVRERSRETPPMKKEQYDQQFPHLNPWDQSFPSNGDLLSAVRALGQLRKIDEVDQDAVVIDLKEANLQGFDLSFFLTLDADYTNADFHKASMQAANLASTTLRGAFFRGADLERASLQRAELAPTVRSKTNFIGSNLRLAQFQDAHLPSAIFIGTNLTNVGFQRSVLTNSRFLHSELSGCSFTEAELQGAQFDGQTIDLVGNRMSQKTSFQRANLRGASLRRMNLQIELTKPSWHPFLQEQIEQLFFDASVWLPSFLTRPDHAPNEVLSEQEFERRWRAWQKSIGFDPEDPSTWN
jgi:uncharacterized protein YjbI with pentapeptide repeats